MRRLPWIALAAMLASVVPAEAEDFSGFYAGLNAGAVLGRDGGRQMVAPNPGPGASAPATEAGLPPSAVSAAGRMEGQRTGARRAGPR